MKTMTIALVLLLTALGTTGFTCVNDSFNVVVNVPLSHDFAINPGPTGTKTGGPATVLLKDFVDASWIEDVTNARLYDIRISTLGTYTGSISGGSVTVDGVQILTFNGTWAQFNTPQSILGTSTAVQPRMAGVNVLVAKLNQLQTNQNVQVSLGATCTITDPSGQVPSGLKLRVEILTQMDAEVGD